MIAASMLAMLQDESLRWQSETRKNDPAVAAAALLK